VTPPNDYLPFGTPLQTESTVLWSHSICIVRRSTHSQLNVSSTSKQPSITKLSA